MAINHFPKFMLLTGLLGLIFLEPARGANPEEGYTKSMKESAEDWTPATSAEVRRKILARPLPEPGSIKVHPRRFGLHGMSYRFIAVGEHEDKTAAAYDLLARAGVESFRTTESWWYQTVNKAGIKELDYQARFAKQYGQTFMFMIGYPPPEFNVSGKQFSAVKPEYEKAYREYLRKVFKRYPGMVDYAELGNEVDAPEVWWQGATPAMYAREMTILRDELEKIDPRVKILSFAATYSRDNKLGAPDGGRTFVRKCLDLGVGKLSDGYSMHYTWNAEYWDLPAFFRQEAAKRNWTKPLVNSEETAGLPWDIIKMFARDFYLHGFERVDYYLARDWYENGHLCATGLFDMDWNPKARLLPYALSVDAMKGRKLIGMAEPANGVEAYVLGWEEGNAKEGSPFSIVMWYDRVIKNPDKKPLKTPVTGLSEVVSVRNWRLDPVMIDKTNPVIVLEDDRPAVVFTKKLPTWKMITPEEWLAKINKNKGNVSNEKK